MADLLSVDDARKHIGELIYAALKLVPEAEHVRALRAVASDVLNMLEERRDTVRPVYGHAELEIVHLSDFDER